MPLRLLLLLLPLVEIALFIAVGDRIGILAVLALVVLGVLAGVAILRGRLARIAELLRAGDDPARLLAGGAMTALGAALLILPGFVTDALGIVLLLPPVQHRIAARLAPRRGPGTWQATVIEGEFVVHDPGDRPAPQTRPELGRDPRRH